MSKRKLSKRQRRAQQLRQRQDRPARTSWTGFVPVVEIPAGGDDPGGTMYRNSRYNVAVRRYPDHFHLAIILNDHSARHDWRDFQRIKNELLGPDAEAVELYPSEDRLIDTTNTFHLWSPVGQRFPFGFDKGRQVESTVESGLPQRPPEVGLSFTAGQRVWVRYMQLEKGHRSIEITLPATVISSTPTICNCVDDKGAPFQVPATCVFDSMESLRWAVKASEVISADDSAKQAYRRC